MVLEILFCKRWTRYDGVGAIVITPTRELAYQIFETLRKIGKHHNFSAGLIIGGKDLKFERKRMDQCNIVICTPGRLLQHMDENPLFDCDTMQVLVLDEADRCLDMGFQETMNSIIDNLPPHRQTLLFSATQTKSVKDLVRLSLKDPRYVSVHKDAKFSTPEGLSQSYIVCELHDKMNFLWSFIKNHRRSKIMVFMSSCKQVKYVFEALCRQKPGVSLLALYGTLHQTRRMNVYDSFCQKQHAVLFSTDIAARGLDFPAVNWVVQLDCPESANEYIHRAGRTARYQKSGESLLVLLPSEIKMLQHLEEKKIPIEEIKVNPGKLQTLQRALEASLAKDVNLKESAHRAFVAYIKSVFLMKDKKVFDVTSLDTDAYARSLGLAIPPRIRFLQKFKKSKEMKKGKSVVSGNKEVDENSKISGSNKNLRWGTNVTGPISTYQFYPDSDDDDKSGGDFLQIKRVNHELEGECNIPETAPHLDLKASLEMGKTSKKKPLTKAAIAKKMLKKKIVANKKIVFDDEGEEIVDNTRGYSSTVAREYALTGAPEGGGIDLETAGKVLREEDKYDKETFRARVREMHRDKKRKLKEQRKKEQQKDEERCDELVCQLGASDDEGVDESEHENESYDGNSEGDNGSDSEETDDHFAHHGDSDVDSANGDSESEELKGKFTTDEESTGGDRDGDSFSGKHTQIDDSEDEFAQKRIQKKRKASKDDRSVRKKIKTSDKNTLFNGLSLNEQEEIALRIMKSNE